MWWWFVLCSWWKVDFCQMILFFAAYRWCKRWGTVEPVLSMRQMCQTLSVDPRLIRILIFKNFYLQGKYDLIIYADLITVVVSGELVMSLFYCAGIAVKMYCVNLFSACQVNTLSGTMLNFQCQPSEFSVGHSVCLPLCQCSCALWYC